MVNQFLHASQWCYKHGFLKGGELFERLMIIFCSAHISGRANIHHNVSFSHEGIGVIVHPMCEIADGCVINTKVTLGNGYPHGGAPKLGKCVYVGSGAFVGEIVRKRLPTIQKTYNLKV